MAPVSTQTHLDRIVARTRILVDERKSAANTADLERAAAAHTPRGFAKALRAQRAANTWPAVIAELKKASPSKGIIRPNFDPAALASSLATNGAACLSVLTDEEFFQGSLTNLEIASASTTIPCLRKDFMVDPFQMLEARASRADAILLIAASLTDAELTTLAHSAKEHALDILCEVHDAEELDRILNLGVAVDLIGVNSRNLHTFVVDLQVQFDIAQQIPSTVLRVAESGVRTRADMDRLTAAGYDAFLIGEALMREPDPGAALSALLHRDPAIQT